MKTYEKASGWLVLLVRRPLRFKESAFDLKVLGNEVCFEC